MNTNGYINLQFDRQSDKWYFYCLNCDKRVNIDEDEPETDKWWDDEGNHRMMYKCPFCDEWNYE